MSKNKSIKHTTEVHTHCRLCGAPIYVRTEYIGGKVREIVNRLCECETDRQDNLERAMRWPVSEDKA